MRRIVLVTGANRGLGLETARLLGRQGDAVWIGARTPDAGAEAEQALRAEGLDACAVTLDVTDSWSVEAAAAEITAKHGRLDVLVNNAGILPEATSDKPSDSPVDVSLFRTTFETNVFGVVNMVQGMLPLLRQSADARIVNVSSTMGSLTDQLDPESPYYGVIVPAYQGSKAALNALTIALSKLLVDTPIKVNAVCPGWLQTDLAGTANRAAAPLPAEAGAQVVANAASAQDAPSGTFTDAGGVVPW